MSKLPAGSDYQVLLDTFLEDSGERLDGMEKCVLELEGRPGDPEPLRTVFRGLHTLKGDAAALGFRRLADFAHLAEDLLESIRSGARKVDGPVTSVLLRIVDALRRLLASEAAGEQPLEELEELAVSCRRLLGETPLAASGASGAVAEGSAATAAVFEAAEELQSLRVKIDKLDRLLDLVGEITVARGRLRQLVKELPDPRAAEAFEAAEGLHQELQELVMNARLVPIGPALRQQGRTVRDLTVTSGKRVRLLVEDHGVEVDARVIEQIRGPLTHLVRNAIDHGIEPPELRARRGKDPVGSLTLRALHHGGSILIQVADDGAGLDRARILTRAVERGLLPAGATLSARELQRLVFAPGFTTAESVTELSGRGVGLDAVHRDVTALRGTVAIDSSPGAGTTVSIRLPMTLTILDGFGIGAGGETYVIPLDAVLECADLPPQDQNQDEPTGVLNLRGQPLPLLRLRHWFGQPGTPEARERVVVVQSNGSRVGLVVERLHGASQAVVKPLSGLGEVPGIFGATVLGSGRVALILDVPGLLERALAQEAAAASGGLESPIARRESP